MKTLVLALDLAGTFVFALSGAMTAVKHRLDLFGILVLSLAAATFGGIGRDLLIGSVPPAALVDWRYIAARYRRLIDSLLEPRDGTRNHDAYE